MTKQSSRIGGDFNYEALEAFRNAYADQLMQPEDQDTDSITGLPTNIVSNTSPYLDGMTLWKYPSGRGPDHDIKNGFNPENFFSNEVLEGEEETESISDEELESIIDELAEEEEEE